MQQSKRGEKVEVPEYVVEVLENMKRMDELAIERMEESITGIMRKSHLMCVQVPYFIMPENLEQAHLNHL